MPYRPLNATRAPNSIRDFIATHVDMQFADMHAMLRLPLDEDGLAAGCNFACLSPLCGIIASASTSSIAKPARTASVQGRTGRLVPVALAT
jgi:hypothetical protein